jgi:hypothetical protein
MHAVTGCVYDGVARCVAYVQCVARCMGLRCLLRQARGHGAAQGCAGAGLLVRMVVIPGRPVVKPCTHLCHGVVLGCCSQAMFCFYSTRHSHGNTALQAVVCLTPWQATAYCVVPGAWCRSLHLLLCAGPLALYATTSGLYTQFYLPLGRCHNACHRGALKGCAQGAGCVCPAGTLCVQRAGPAAAVATHCRQPGRAGSVMVRCPARHAAHGLRNAGSCLHVCEAAALSQRVQLAVSPPDDSCPACPAHCQAAGAW